MNQENSALVVSLGGKLSPIYRVISDVYSHRGGDFDREAPFILDAEQSAIRLLEKPLGLKGFKGMEAAADLLHETLIAKKIITIVGDYDVDGASATAVLIRGLSSLTKVHAVIPDRQTEGYGLTPLLAKRIPEDTYLVITVDNGIAAVAGAEAVREMGKKLLITDHHLPGENIPEADAIVDANQQGCPFPWKSTCGAGVAWYLLWALQLRHPEWKQRMRIRDLLALVAVATVADVVSLETNNRHLVRIGLDIIRQGRGPLGLHALMQIAGKDAKQVTSIDCGFIIGPRINAVGRLENMMTGLDLLTSDNEDITHKLAREMDTVNRERRQIEGDSMDAAFAQALKKGESFFDGGQSIVVVADTDWHEGVVGLIAGRVREKLLCPTFVFARAHHGGWKGSGRSVQGFHLRDAIAWVKACYPDLIGNFGGHAMAAGLFLPDQENQSTMWVINQFREAIQKYPAWILWKNSAHSQDDYNDGWLPSSLLNLSTAIALRSVGPWGAGFSEPVFEGIFEVVDRQEMKGGHWRLRISPCEKSKPYLIDDESPIVTAVRFLRDQQTPVPLPDLGGVIKVTYTLQVNRWREKDTLQLLLDKVDYLSR